IGPSAHYRYVELSIKRLEEFRHIDSWVSDNPVSFTFWSAHVPIQAHDHRISNTSHADLSRNFPSLPNKKSERWPRNDGLETANGIGPQPSAPRFVSPVGLQAGERRPCVSSMDRRSSSRPSAHKSPSKYLKGVGRARHTTGEPRN